MIYQSQATAFQIHPEGQHEGAIYAWEDLGTRDTVHGPKHRGAFKIESFTAKMDDGRPFIAYESANIAFGQNAKLRQWRVSIAGRNLTKEEARSFDPREIVGVKVGYKIVHNPRQDGDGAWANIDSIWRLDDQEKGTIVNPISIATKEDDPAEVVLDGEKDSNSGNNDIDNLREYIVGLIDLCAEHNIMDAESSAKWASHIAETDSVSSFRLFSSDFEGKLMAKKVKFERKEF